MTGGTWYVEVVRSSDDTVTATIGPGTLHRMKIADSGMQINLNHDAYYTRLVQRCTADTKEQ